MVKWDDFEPSDFEYDFDNDELARHRVTFEEAIQVFENGYRVRLKLIVQIKTGDVVRIITGWDR